MSKARAFAKSKGKELIDVEEQDKGKEYKTASIGSTVLPTDDDTSTDNTSTDDPTTTSSSPETWGDEARIIEDYEGRAIIVDSLFRTEITFQGSNKDTVRAYVIATRVSLRGYLAGGNRTITTSSSVAEYATNRAKDIQLK